MYYFSSLILLSLKLLLSWYYYLFISLLLLSYPFSLSFIPLLHNSFPIHLVYYSFSLLQLSLWFLHPRYCFLFMFLSSCIFICLLLYTSSPFIFNDVKVVFLSKTSLSILAPSISIPLPIRYILVFSINPGYSSNLPAQI